MMEESLPYHPSRREELAPGEIGHDGLDGCCSMCDYPFNCPTASEDLGQHV